MPIPNFQGTHLLSPAKFFFWFCPKTGSLLGNRAQQSAPGRGQLEPSSKLQHVKIDKRVGPPLPTRVSQITSLLAPPHPKMGADFCAQTQLLRLKILVLQSSPHHTSPTAPASLTDASAANLSPL